MWACGILTAMAMAMDDSVTVSMGDEISGVFRVIFRVRAEVRSLITVSDQTCASTQ